jgi:cyclomaltodextrinase / maltogenic alpha-amylase / neopullulanase
VDKNLSFRISPDSMQMTLVREDKNLPKLSVMNIWIGGFCYSLLLEKSRKVWQQVVFDPKGKNYKKVELTGEITEEMSKKVPMHLKDGKWETSLFLIPGKYQYLIIADGKTMLDPGNPEITENMLGKTYSLLRVGSPNPPGVPYLYSEKMEKNKISVGIKNKTSGIFVFWQNYQLNNKFVSTDSAGLKIIIPGKAKEFDRSFLRIWAYNAAGFSNEIRIPLQKGNVITDVSNLTRNDKEAMIVYNLLVDRFRNGNPKNDAPVNDKNVDPSLNFQGGDLAGITEKIKEGYFTNLGVNTLKISPIYQNPLNAWTEFKAPHKKTTGYLGNWPVMLTKIDSRFGSAEEMKNLVGEAHGKNINIILDVIPNYVHQDSKIYKEHSGWTTPMLLPKKKKNIQLWEEQRYTTWFEEFLPTLDLAQQEVSNMSSDSVLFWTRNYTVDGFGFDATQHIPDSYWRMLTQKLKEQVVVPDNREVLQFGETYGARNLINSFVHPGEFEGQVDFDLFFDARKAFTRDGASFKDLNYTLLESFSYYGEHSLMGNISDNLDFSRFISEVKDTIGFSKLASLMAFNLTIPGIPCILYGDEFGMSGAGIPENSGMMKFDQLSSIEKRLKSTMEKLIHMRSHNLPLLYGDFKTLQVSEKTFVYMRTYFDKVVVVIFNKDKSDKKITFEIPQRFENAKLVNHFGSDAKLEKEKISLTLKGNSFEILTN